MLLHRIFPCTHVREQIHENPQKQEKRARNLHKTCTYVSRQSKKERTNTKVGIRKEHTKNKVGTLEERANTESRNTIARHKYRVWTWGKDKDTKVGTRREDITTEHGTRKERTNAEVATRKKRTNTDVGIQNHANNAEIQGSKNAGDAQIHRAKIGLTCINKAYTYM